MKAKIHLSVVAMLLGTTMLAKGTPDVTAPLPQPDVRPTVAMAGDSLFHPVAQTSAVALSEAHKVLETSVTEMLQAKEEMLSQRYLTEFTVPEQAPRPDRLVPLQMSLQQTARTKATTHSTAKGAFHIPGDSLQLMAKDHSFNGSLYTAQVTAKQDGDSIALYNVYGWGAMEGYRAPRAYVADNGAVTIPAQLIMNHKTYGAIWIAPMKQQNGGIVYSFDPITGQMDAQGNISVGGWGLFVPEGSHKNTLFNAFSASEWKPCNATFRSPRANKDEVVEGYALIEQTAPGEIALYNVSGGDYGEVLYARLNANKTALISPQKVFTNSMLGDFYCYPASYADGKASVDMKGNILLTATDSSLNLAPWAITARGASNYAAAFYLNTIIKTTWRPQWPVEHTPTFAGKGTQADPYKLANANDMAVLAEKINGGDQSYAMAWYELANDIDWSGLTYPFQPIGTEANPFKGRLDGKNHAIKNFKYDGRGFSHTGLFAFTGLNSEISNLTMSGVDLKGGGRFTGAFAAESWSTLTNVHVEGKIVSTGEVVGGIVANNCAPIDQSSFTGEGTSGGTWGGIAGDTYASITRSHTNVNIATIGYMSSLYHHLAGIAGTAMVSGTVMLPVEISDCYVQGTLTDRLGYAQTAGIVATLANGATITRCFNTASISAKRLAGRETDDPTGGIVGFAREGSVTDCYNAGTIVKSGESDMVGGVVAYLSVGYITTSGLPTQMAYQCYVKNCYNSGQIVSSSAENRKGVIGSSYFYLDFDPIGECISNCYNDSQITGLKGTVYDMTTSALTSTTLPTGFSSTVWQTKAGYYPTLRTIADNDAVRLSSVALHLAAQESSRKMKSTATMSQAQDVSWKLFDGDKFVDATDALAINGNSLSVKDKYSNSILVALGKGASMRMYRLAVVPKAFEGEGTQESPYLIRTVADFRKLNEAVATYQQPHEGDFFRMTNDIDFNLADDFSGVGYRYSPAIGFGGTFDGGGFTIHKLKIAAVSFDADGKAVTDNSYLYTGLFNHVTATGTVRNLTIASDCQMSHWSAGGGVAGYNSGVIENCRNYAVQTAITDYVGGITGFNVGTLKNCYNAASVTTGRSYAGGIAGANTSLIELCQNDGDITGKVINDYIPAESQNSVGGIVGGCATDSAKVVSCLNQGTVSAYKQLGGISGMSNYAFLKGNISTGLVSSFGTDPTIGAFVGSYIRLEGENNYFDGSVILCEAANSSGRPGFTSLNSKELTTGKAPQNFPNATAWNFAAGSYPVLKNFAAETASKALSAMYIGFGKDETRANVQHTTPLSQAEGLEWKLTAPTSQFTLSTGNINVTPPQGMSIGRDTLNVAMGGYAKAFHLQTVPVIFQGAGTAQTPYELRTADDLNRLSQFIYATGFDYANTYFKVMNDIVFAETDTISPIAKGGSHQFSGIFDGNGKTISGFKYENTVIVNTASKPHPMGYPGRYMGFFGKIGSTGRVHDLTLKGDFKIYSHLGGLVGDLYGLVENCHVLSTLTTSNQGNVGGIVSRLYAGGIVRNCEFKGTITAKTTLNGGIASYVYAGGLVEGCTMAGSLSGTTTNGGIVGDLYGTARNCKTLKEATFATTNNLGGIAYRVGVDGLIEGCENYADLIAPNTTSSYYAGIATLTVAKSNGAAIRNCVNYGEIKSKSYSAGILSRLYSGASVENCVNHGTVTSTGASQTGGIIANSNTAPADYPEFIKGCVNYGDIHGFASYIGGIAGDVNTGVEIDSCLNYGNITSTATSSHLAVGGVAGVTRGTMTRCLNAGNLSTVGHGTGGITGLIQSGKVNECANLGNVVSTGAFPASKPNGMVGGIVGYTVTSAQIHDCYNMGNLTGTLNMGGLMGRAAAGSSTPDIPLENCYTFGKLTVTSDVEDPVSANLYVRNSGVNVVWKNIYYNSDVNTISYRYDPSGRGRSETEMQTVELGDNYVQSRAMLPRLSWLVGNDAADFAAISLKFYVSTDKPDHITEYFFVGCPKENLQWELSPQFRMSKSDPGKIYPVSLGNGTIKVSTPDGKYSRTFNLTVDKTTGVEEYDVDGAIPVSTEYYTLQGTRIQNPAPGSMVIVRTVYSDGTVTTAKTLIR